MLVDAITIRMQDQETVAVGVLMVRNARNSLLLYLQEQLGLICRRILQSEVSTSATLSCPVPLTARCRVSALVIHSHQISAGSGRRSCQIFPHLMKCWSRQHSAQTCRFPKENISRAEENINTSYDLSMSSLTLWILRHFICIIKCCLPCKREGQEVLPQHRWFDKSCHAFLSLRFSLTNLQEVGMISD